MPPAGCPPATLFSQRLRALRGVGGAGRGGGCFLPHAGRVSTAVPEPSLRPRTPAWGASGSAPRRGQAAKCPPGGGVWRGEDTKAGSGSQPAPARRLRSGPSTQDYSLSGFVWSSVSLSPEHPGHGVSLKVTVVCDSLREPLTFTCDCEWPSGGGREAGAAPNDAWGRDFGGVLPLHVGGHRRSLSPQARPPWTC